MKKQNLFFFTLFLFSGIYPLVGKSETTLTQTTHKNIVLAKSEKDFINQLAKIAIISLTSPNSTDAEKHEKFKALFKQNFDVAAVSKFVLGRYNKRATPEERKEYQKLFIEHVSKIYSGYLNQYNEKAFQTLRTIENKRGGIWVVSQVVREKAPPINIKWLVFKSKPATSPTTYKIYDVIVEGVSLSVAQRSEYAAIIQKNGGTIQGLLKVMKQNIGSCYNKKNTDKKPA